MYNFTHLKSQKLNYQFMNGFRLLEIWFPSFSPA